MRAFALAHEAAAVRAKDLTQQLLTFAKGGEPVRVSTPLPEIVREAAVIVDVDQAGRENLAAAIDAASRGWDGSP